MDRTLVKVLLVEDNPADALLLQESLSGDLLTDFQVTVAERLRQGLEELGARPYDVVLLDLGLPDSQGLGTFEAAHAEFPDIPMIVLSGASDEWLALQAVKSGAQDYLVKGEADWHFGARSIRYAIERHQSQLAVRASEARFSTIFHNSPTAIAITRISDNCLLEVNEAWTQITGYSSGQAVGQRIEKLNTWVDLAQRKAMLELLRRDGVVRGFEFKLRRKSGELADLLMSAELIELSGEFCMLSMALDITERKQVEEALRLSEERLRVTLTNSNIIVAEVDEALRYTWIQNPHKDFGNAQIIGKCDDELGSNEGTAKITALRKKVLATGMSASDEVTFPLSNGNLTYLVLAEPRRNEHSDVVGVTTASIDITERKQAEEALRLSEERHRLISGMISDYVYSGVAYPGGRARTEWISGAFEQITGYTVEELKSLPLGFASLLLPEDLEKVASRHQLLFENRSLTSEYRVRRKDGEIRWLLDRMSAVADGAETHAVRIIGGVEDITERKLVEGALRESAAMLARTESVAHVGSWEWNVAADTVTWSEELFRIFQIDPSEGAPSFAAHPKLFSEEDMQGLREAVEGAVNHGAPYELELRAIRRDGATRICLARGHAKMGPQGKAVRLFGMFQDITERKLAEEKIAQTEKRFKSLIERAPDGVVLIGPDLNFTYVSPTAKRIFGYDDDAPIDIPPNDATHPDDLPRVLEALSCLIQDPSLMPTLQYRFRRKNGAWLWIESTFTNLFAEPSVNAIVINFRDVTERVEAERKIQESEERSRLAHSAADLGTWQEDLVEHTFALDERACRHYDQDDEYPSSAVITRCVHPEDLPRLQDVTRSTISAGRDLLRVEYRVVHRDGSIRWLAIHSQVYFEERNGVRTPLMAAGTSQDITERKAADDELARRNRQLRLIYEATQRLNFSLDPAHVHEVIYASVRELMPCDTLFISAFDSASSMISMAGGWHDGRPVDLAGYEPIPLEPQGSGIQSRVIRTKEPELIQDFQARLKNVQVAHHHDGEGHPVDELPEEGDIPRSALAVPLLAEGNVLGVIQVFSYRLDAYTGDDLQILNGFSAQAAIALSNARLYESVQQENLERQRAEASLLARTTQLEALFNISDHLGSAQTEQQALSVVMAELKPLMGAHAGAIALVEPDRQHIKLVRAEHLLAQNLGQRFLVEEGICGKVLRSGQVYLTDSYADDPFRVKEVAGVESLGPAVFAPIRAEDDYIGVLVASREKNSQSRPFDADAVRMMTAIGEIAGSALRRVRLFEQTSAQLSQLRTLQKVDRAITGSLDLDLTLRLLLTEITSHLAVDAAAVLLLHPHSLILECAAAHGFRQRSIEQTHIMIGQCVAGRAALTHETIHITDLQNDANFSRRQMVAEEGFQSYSVAPLITKGKVVGVFEFYSRGVIERGLDWDDFLETLADQATIAIENARLFSDLQRSNLEMELAYDATIEGWARAVDLRGHEAEGHSVRMSELALGLAASMGMREADMIHLRRGALLHDIGNLGIPDEILLKQSELTPEEWEVMRRHPVMAYELLHPIQFLRPALDIPYCHHEKWDGSGYPRGLAGERIPLAARIFSVADEFAALTSDRPYRPAWTRDKAISYIEEQSGLHFDPQVVNAFRLWVRIH